ncbi:kinetochore protein [Cutibacterium acnes]|uniref:kinetochore protein n=1 Tax=Cutibacterium acnes TaxID=1747 RepID=UPI00257260BD|nr:kinetochore protein [Cutibacterium acnes]
MLGVLAKSATTPTYTHHHGGGHNRLTGTITPDTVCTHHSTFPPISHDHRPNRNIYRFSSYSVRRQSSMASESMQAQLP